MTELELNFLKQEGQEPSAFKAPLVEAAVVGGKVRYDNWAAITYAKNYCGQKDNACGDYYDQPGKTDCAHFMAHCLDAGGIAIKPGIGSDTTCPQGLAMRNTDLVPALKKLAATYSNVAELGIGDAIVGDIGFLSNLLRPSHAFMICEPVDLREPLKPAKVWAHTSARCCDDMKAEIRQWFATMFRITDAT